MKKSLKIVGALLLLCAVFAQVSAQMQVERLNRGLIAVRMGQGYYLSWRLLADEPFNTGFNVYHGTTRLNSTPITGATIYTDANRAQMTTSAYTVRAVVGGVEREASELAMIINNVDGAHADDARNPTAGYIQINLQRPPTGQFFSTYSPGDGSVGDLDGDGVYEIIIKWDPQNQIDNGTTAGTGSNQRPCGPPTTPSSGNNFWTQTTDKVFIDAYKLDGTRLWRIDLGENIRAGAHYTQFLVYDFDGDGKAEIMMKTAEGTRDGTGNFISMGPAATGNHTAIRRITGTGGSCGRILSGPEYLTVFNGQTGAEMSTITYLPGRDPVDGWGNNESYGNRVDRFNAAVAYLDGERPSAVFNRGYYGRLTLWAVDWRNGQLTQRWLFDSNSSGNSSYSGQGNHQMSVADADGDGRHDIITGSAVIRHNGTGMHTSRLGHGDALHVAHMIKNTPTPQIFMPHESGSTGLSLRHANNGTMIFTKDNSEDVGRGVAAELDPARPGFKFWGARSMGLYNVDGTTASSTLPSSINHVIWWDGDLARELLDGYAISSWSVANNSATRLLSATGYGAVNGTKNNPVLQADIFGDWREEVIFSNGTNAIRIYTSAIPTTHRLVTLMHDPTYRVAIAWQNSSYNQPPHPGYYIASDMDAGFPLNVAVIGGTSPQCTPGVDCAGDPCPAGQIGVRPNCTTPPWVNIAGGEFIDTLRLYDPDRQASWSVQSNLTASTAAFGDRQHNITAIPAALQGAEWVRPAMDSRTLTSRPDTLIRFNMKKTGRVYIAYERRVTTKPSWLNARGFTQVSGTTLTVTEAGGDVRTFDIYMRDFTQGQTVVTGINSTDGLTNSMIYLIAVTNTPTTSIRENAAPTKYAMNITRTNRGSFNVNYTIKDRGNVRLDLFDVKGVRVRTFVNTSKNPGVYQKHISTQGLAAGMYLVKLRVGGTVLQERVVVTR